MHAVRNPRSVSSATSCVLLGLFFSTLFSAVFGTMTGCVTKAPLHAVATDTLESTKETRYTHDIRIDAASGVYEVDCSGFVEHALEVATPQALADLRAGLPALVGRSPKRPLAKHFVAYFQALARGEATSAHWLAVTRVEDLRPGDVVAWLMPEELESRNTGHVMIVRGSVRSASDANEWIVPITDATSVRHGRTDSRFPNKATGVGTGEIVLATRASNAEEQNEGVFGYRWSPESKNLRQTTVAMARPR